MRRNSETAWWNTDRWAGTHRILLFLAGVAIYTAVILALGWWNWTLFLFLGVGVNAFATWSAHGRWTRSRARR